MAMERQIWAPGLEFDKSALKPESHILPCNWCIPAETQLNQITKSPFQYAIKFGKSLIMSKSFGAAVLEQGPT